MITIKIDEEPAVGPLERFNSILVMGARDGDGACNYTSKNSLVAERK